MSGVASDTINTVSTDTHLDPPHRAYFQNKGHLSQADTARVWRPYDDLPPGWEGVVTPNASVKGDWG